MRTLITGGAGFLGFHLGLSLADSGHEVVLVDNLVRGSVDSDLAALLEREGVELVNADLESPDTWGRLEGRFDEVYHLAAVIGVRHVMSDPARVLRVNTRTVMNAVEFFQSGEHGRFFFASTSEAYAWTAKVMPLPVPTPESVPLCVDDIENRRASYALSKIVGEMLVVNALADTPQRYIVGRFHNVYGPRMGTAHVIPELFIRMREGERPLEVTEANATRAFCYVSDAVASIRHLMADSAEGVYNIGNDAEETRIGDLVEVIADVAEYPIADVRLDEVGVPAIPRRCPSIEKLREAGFSPTVGLRDGVRATLEWYAERQLVRGI